jgi:amino acid adenylation domain-containing protein
VTARLLQDLVGLQAARDGEKIAVADGPRRLSYAELERRSSRLAHVLGAEGCGDGDRVAILIPKSLEAITALLGVLKAGALYVPLDTASPAARLRKVMAACEPRVLLHAGSAAGLAAALAEGREVRLGSLEDLDPAFPGFDRADVESAPDSLPSCGRRPEDPAHILFTSGSTGEPKGVVISHGNVLAFVRWANAHFGLGPDDRTSGHSPLFFDLSTYDIYGTFAAGAELHLVPPQLNLLPQRLAAFIRERRLTQWFSVPSILSYMVQLGAVREGDFPELRRVLWCGEVFPTAALLRWMERVPHVTYTNLYGPTEATIASSFHDVLRKPADPGEEVPIGRACAGEELLVLDAARNPLPDGTPGDLYIGGVGLSEGYWRAPELTTRSFVEVPGRGRLYRTGDRARRDASGRFHYLGRVDQQIKSRGYRIELGEIENALQCLDDLRESAVVAVPTDGFEGCRICAAYVPREAASSVSPAELRRKLGERLPGYMIPSEWGSWQALPRTPNGKVDRKGILARFLGTADSKEVSRS